MLEKDIENLIAQHPEEFFPKEGFVLIQQQYPAEGRRLDILFRDKSNRKIIIEVKRGILSREASGQIAEYYRLLKSENKTDFYELILCANVIPKERKLFLEHIGIECKEIGIGHLSEVANKYHYSFLDQDNHIEVKKDILLNDHNREIINKEEISVWIFQANPQRYDILNALSDKEIDNNKHWLVNQYKSKIKQGHLGLIWMSGKDAGIYAIARIDSDPKIMMQYEPEKKYWFDSDECDKKAMRVELSIIKRLINKPILKKDILKTRGLETLSILRQWQGTNFQVSNQEWEIISQQL